MSTTCFPHIRHFPLGRLLERIRDFPFLYDRNCPEFRDTALKDNRLRIIATEFGITAEQSEYGETLSKHQEEQCKRKWRNARDRCTRIRQKLEAVRRSGVEEKDIRKPHWRHYGLLDSMLEDCNSAHVTNVSHISSAPTITSSWSICMETDGTPEVIEGASNSTAGRSSGSASCDDEYSEEVPQPEEQSYSCNGSHRREIVPGFNGDAHHGDQSCPENRAAPRKRKPAVDPPVRDTRDSCESSHTDPVGQSVIETLEKCSAALGRLANKGGQQRKDDCDIEATWIASKLKAFPPRHRCQVAHKIHCILHEEEMKLYE